MQTFGLFDFVTALFSYGVSGWVLWRFFGRRAVLEGLVVAAIFAVIVTTVTGRWFDVISAYAVFIFAPFAGALLTAQWRMWDWIARGRD